MVDRDFRHNWETKGGLDVTERAHRRVEEIIAAYEPRELPAGIVRELEAITLRAAQATGMDSLPDRE